MYTRYFAVFISYITAVANVFCHPQKQILVSVRRWLYMYAANLFAYKVTSVVFAIRQCAAWASTLITHEHCPQQRKPRETKKRNICTKSNSILYLRQASHQSTPLATTLEIAGCEPCICVCMVRPTPPTYEHFLTIDASGRNIYREKHSAFTHCSSTF